MVDVAVRNHHIPIVSKLSNVGKCYDAFSPEHKKDPDQILSQYDQVVYGDLFLNTYTHLRAEDYYQLAAKRLNQRKAEFPKLMLEKGKRQDNLVCLHTTASNINRGIPNQIWDNLAYSLSESGYEVLFLGTRGDYGFTDEENNIRKASDSEESLLGQSQLLARSGMFIGISSGFSHIAGILGIKGIVILTNTGYNVCKNYATLKAIENFSKDLSPSHSLAPYCPVTEELANSITCEQICKEIGIIPVTQYQKADTSTKLKVKISNDPGQAIKPYLTNFKIVESDEDVHLTLIEDILVKMQSGDVTLTFASHYLNLPRVIRDITQKAGKEKTCLIS